MPKRLPPIKDTYTSIFDSFSLFPKSPKIKLGTRDDDIKALEQDFNAIRQDFDKAMKG